MLFRIFILVFSSLFITGGQLYSQCCAAGNPLSNDVDFSHKGKNSFSAGLIWRYSLSDAMYSGSKKMDVGFIDKTDFHYTEAIFRYGISSRAYIRAELGYFLRKGEYYKGGFSPAIGYGVGDLAINGAYQLFAASHKMGEMVAGMGCKLPVGVFDQEDGNVKLPVNVQPSSGSYKGSAFVFYRKNLGKEFALSALISTEVASKIRSVNFHYRYGNAYVFIPGITWNAKPQLMLSLMCKAEHRGRSIRNEDTIIESSGGQLISLNPSVSYRFAGKYLASFGALLPVYRYMNGIQAGNTYGLHASVVFTK